MSENIRLVTYGWVLEESYEGTIWDSFFLVPTKWLNENFNNFDYEEYTHENGYEVFQQALKDNVIVDTYLEKYND